MPAQRVRVDPPGATGIWRHSRADAALVSASVAHAACLAVAPFVVGNTLAGAGMTVLLATALWWNANSVSHNFIHLPFFHSGLMNRTYSVFLSPLLGVPQSLWRDRHLAHHAAGRFVLRWSAALVVETLAVAALWLLFLLVAPRFFVTIYIPAWLAGLGLCRLQGHFEHAPTTRSHYGALYNAAFFNDGYHAEHHEQPDCHWAQLPARGPRHDASRFPPVLRWLELAGLTGLERLVLRSGRLQTFVLRRHERALGLLLPALGPVRSLTIVGGGLFPRTAVIVRRLLPEAHIRIVDASQRHLETARRILADAGLDAGVEFVCEQFESGSFDASSDALVTPLSLIGDRAALYRRPPARRALVHDWIWRRGPGESARVSWLLLKRLNLLHGPCGD